MPRADAPGAGGPPPPGGWVPDWPVPAHVRAFMSTRTGGVSVPPFDSFNLGSHVRDDPAAVARNRQLLAHRLQARPVFLEQVHGVHCVHVAPDTPDATVADACFTQTAGVACTVMVADCLPVLLADTAGRVVAAAHAGWRSLAGAEGEGGEGGILAHTFRQICALPLHPKGDEAINFEYAGAAQPVGGSTVDERPPVVEWVAWLGPCIGPTAFEVGEDVRRAFTTHAGHAAACFQPVAGRAGKYLCDLAGLARLQLAALGVTRVHGNDGSARWCTVSQPGTWFSHRRDAGPLGSTGRMAASVWLAPASGAGGGA